MGVILCVRPGDGGTIVAISGEVDVGTEAPLQQALLRSSASAVRRIIELTGAQEALAAERSTTARSVQFF